jgi:hypothetical protein
MMDVRIERRTFYVEGQSLELWSVPSADFSCQPEDIRDYIAGQRWDLVYNALYHLAGAVEEGLA